MSEASQKTASRWKDQFDSWIRKIQDVDGNNYDFEFRVFTQELITRKTVRMSRCLFLPAKRRQNVQVGSSPILDHLLELTNIVLDTEKRAFIIRMPRTS